MTGLLGLDDMRDLLHQAGGALGGESWGLTSACFAAWIRLDVAESP